MIAMLQPNIFSVPLAWRLSHLMSQIWLKLVLVQFVEHMKSLSLSVLCLAVTHSVTTVYAQTVRQTPSSPALHAHSGWQQ